MNSGRDFWAANQTRQEKQRALATQTTSWVPCLVQCLYAMHSRRRVNRRYMRGSPTGFFNPVIPTQNFVQSRNPEGYFWHPTSQAYFQSRNTPRFCFQIPNPEVYIREFPGAEKPIEDAHMAVWQFFLKHTYRTKQTCSHLFEKRPKGRFHTCHKSKITLRNRRKRREK